MKVSVIIPVYNAALYLNECIESVLGQTFEDFELICVNDGSNDGSSEILRRFEQMDRRLVILTQDNKGGGAARNAALDIARGEYLAFLDADDSYEPTMLEEMTTAADDNRCDVVMCRSYSLNAETLERGNLDHSIQHLKPHTVYSPDNIWEYAFRYCVGWPWDKLFRRSFIEKNNLRFQELQSTNDAFFVFIALAVCESLMYIESHLVNHRIGNMTSIENTREKSWNNAFCAMEAIENELRERGLYEKAEQSFLNWVIHYSLWGYRTLVGDAQIEFIKFFKENFLKRVYGLEKGYYYLPHEYDAVQLLGSDPDIVLARACKMIETDKWASDEIAKLWNIVRTITPERDRLLAERDALSHNLSALQVSYDSLMMRYGSIVAEKRAIEESTSYRMGRIITAVPRHIKDAIHQC